MLKWILLLHIISIAMVAVAGAVGGRHDFDPSPFLVPAVLEAILTYTGIRVFGAYQTDLKAAAIQHNGDANAVYLDLTGSVPLAPCFALARDALDACSSAATHSPPTTGLSGN